MVMDRDTNKQSELLTTKITENHQTAHPAAATVSQSSSSVRKFQISSDYFRMVDRTTDIAGRLPNAVYTLPPRLVQAIVGRAELSAATREALVAECKKFFLASREYEESKVVFVDKYCNRSTTITLDYGRLYSESNNDHGQCGIGSDEPEVTGPRLIRLPPVLRVSHYNSSWFATTTRGLYAWGWNSFGKLGVGSDDESVMQPRRVLTDGDVLDVSLLPGASFFRTDSGWFGCGDNSYGKLGFGHTFGMVPRPTPIPSSEGVTRWGGDFATIFGFSDDGLLSCGMNVGQCGVGSTERLITTLTPVALPDDVKGKVDRVVCNGNGGSSFFIADRRCFDAGCNKDGQLGLGLDEWRISTPTELPIPVNDVITDNDVTVIRSGNTLLACGSNEYRQISTDNRRQFTSPTPLDLPGPVVKVFIDWARIFIQLTDGSWVGRGECHSGYFIPVPEADLINSCCIPGWTPANDDFAEKLNMWVVDNVMILPGPIANK